MHWLRTNLLTFAIVVVAGTAVASLGGLLMRERTKPLHSFARDPEALMERDRSYEHLFANADSAGDIQLLPAPEPAGATQAAPKVDCGDRPMDSLPHPTPPGAPAASYKLRRLDQQATAAPCGH